jgi:hypothetical protein
VTSIRHVRQSLHKSFKLIQNHNAGMKDKSATDNISTKKM